MNLIKVKITPLSSFITFPKGDTIFGHFAYYSFLRGEDIFKKYIVEEKPKIIFSDILPDKYVYKPALPLTSFIEDRDKKWLKANKKEFKKKSWINLSDLKNIKIQNKVDFRPYKKLNFYKTDIKVQNSLNRISFTTDDSGTFAPFSLKEITFIYQPVIYVMFDSKSFKEKEIEDRLNEIGKNSFGKKGSIGKGYFKAKIDKDFKGFDEVETKYYLTLSPTLLHKSKDIIEDAYYNTFNRFGKYHSTSTPFKKPLLMVDSGAVVKLKETREFIGGAIENGINEQSLVQGYSILVPFRFNGKGLTNG